jgi:hypothetical protein
MKEKITFESLGITNPPYVDEYREKFGAYPTMKLYERAWLRTGDPEGFFNGRKDGVYSRCLVRHKFEVVGVLRDPDPATDRSEMIILKHPENDLCDPILLTPAQLVDKMHIIKPRRPKAAPPKTKRKVLVIL